MAGKQQAAEPSRRNLAQKLTGFMRHGSTRSKQAQPSDQVEHGPASSVFRAKRQKNAPAQHQQQPQQQLGQLQRLEVDLKAVEAYRLSDGWLEPEKPKPAPEEKKKEEEEPAPAPENTATPIAAMFAKRSASTIRLLGPESPVRSEFSNRDSGAGRPYSWAEPVGRSSADLTSNHDAQSVVSILDRGRPIEAAQFGTDDVSGKPKSTRNASHESATSAATEPAAPPKGASSSMGPPSRAGSTRSATGAAARAHLRSREFLQETPGAANRHSMYAAVPQSPSQPQPPNHLATAARTAHAPRSASAMPLGRIEAWQKGVNPTASNSSAPSQPPFAAGLRKTSGLAGSNRLAWIRELEEKKSGGLGKDVEVLKRQSGSVSDKLAMFEGKGRGGGGGTGASTPRLGPLTLSRSNSTTSRFSAAGLDSSSGGATGGGPGAASTPRTSIDTVRSSSHRASSVMDNYDDSFRERLEGIASTVPPPEEDEEEKKKTTRRVTAQFVSVQPPSRKKRASVSSNKRASTTSEKLETPVVVAEGGGEGEAPAPSEKKSEGPAPDQAAGVKEPSEKVEAASAPEAAETPAAKVEEAPAQQVAETPEPSEKPEVPAADAAEVTEASKKVEEPAPEVEEAPAREVAETSAPDAVEAAEPSEKSDVPAFETAEAPVSEAAEAPTPSEKKEAPASVAVEAL
ncbi:hypothetical protein GGR56DRAFT_695352 [Xylariaceae sp. FL0804]|nr:hypothetical protein GGR56DRAFT_695352 [Xylariaceae sp. FL0804]